MKLSLDNQVAVVTGAAGVLCSSLAKSLLECGAKVVLLGRTASKVENLAKKFADEGLTQTLAIGADVLDKQSLINAKKKINDTWGAVSILVNGAGGNSPGATSPQEVMDSKEGSFFEMDLDGFDQVMKLNYNGTLLPCMVFGEDMLDCQNASIINISSMSAISPLTKVAGYSSSKAAINNFTQWLAVHFSKKGIRVNAIAPGFFVSEQNRFLLYEEDGKTLTPRGNKIIKATPMEQFGNPEDLNGALAFLCSPQARFITGVVLPIDGGFSAYSGV